MKTIGVLGGMGPDATVLFFKKVVEFTPAETDQQHIPMIINNSPQIPDRTRAILGMGESPLPALVEGAFLLKNAGVDFICIPCNTAHLWYEDLAAAVEAPMLNLIECVRDRVLEEAPDIDKVGLLATKGTIKSELYQKAFAPHEVSVLMPDEWTWNDLQATIDKIKHKSRDVHFIQELVDDLVRKGAQAIILGCTEFGLIAHRLQSEAPLFESVEILAQESVKAALGKQPI